MVLGIKLIFFLFLLPFSLYATNVVVLEQSSYPALSLKGCTITGNGKALKVLSQKKTANCFLYPKSKKSSKSLKLFQFSSKQRPVVGLVSSFSKDGECIASLYALVGQKGKWYISSKPFIRRCLEFYDAKNFEILSNGKLLILDIAHKE